MNKVSRTLAKIQPFQLKHAFFHSSPILERKRRPDWESKFNNYYHNRSRKMNAKREVLEDCSTFADDLFQRWRDDYEEYNPPSNRTHSSRRTQPWFKQEFFSDRNRGGPNNRGPKTDSGRTFDFSVHEDYDYEAARTDFGNKDFFYTFTSKDFDNEPYSSYNSRSQRRRRHEYDYEYVFPEEFRSRTDLTSYRLTLGLNASGPLSMEDVKKAYRTCALKWHPDRHQGPSKAVAEEKFKLCSAAYQTLCDKLALS